MGCDFFWEAEEEDIFRQRRCGWFLESLFDADERGVSSFFPSERWHCETFNGYYSGYFLDLDKKDRQVELTSLHLIGTTIYLGELWDMDGWMSADAARQYSFVFNNTSYDPAKLITIEIISDPSKPKYDHWRKYFDGADEDANHIKAMYRAGGYDRLLANEGWLAGLLRSIQRQFLPGLEASDDYGLVESSMAAEYPLSPGFSEAICKPELAEKWGFGYLKLLDKLSK